LKIRSSQRKSIAAIPTAFKGQERRYAQSVSENLDTLSGRRGNIIDRAVTFRDLLDSGVLRLAGGILSDGGIDVTNPNDPDSNPNGPTELPTKPTNLNASGGFNVVALDWGLAPYNGHDYVEIFRFQSNSLSSAEAAGAYVRYYGDAYFYFDQNVGSQETWYYWVRAVNKDGVAGPFNQLSGTPATTALDYIYISGLIDTILSDDASNLGLTTAIDGLSDFTGYFSGYNGDSLITRMGDVETVAGNAVTSAQLSAESTTRATADTAITAIATTAQATANGASASVSVVQSAVSGPNGVESKYAVKVDTNGLISGFGLISQANNEPEKSFSNFNGTSAFVISADKFAIGAPYDSNYSGVIGNQRYPFKVITQPNTVFAADGTAIPVGVYIEDVFIHDAQITNAKIGNATITSAKIFNLSATRISTGNISIDNSNNIAIFQGKRTFSYYDAVLQKNIYVPDFSSVTAGFALGNNNGTPYFHIGDANNYLKFDGSTMEVTGASIKQATIGTLQIGPNAVTVPVGASNGNMANLITTSTTNWTHVITSPSVSWTSSTEKPSAFIVQGICNFLSQVGGGQVGLYLRVEVIRSNQSNYIAQTVGVSKAIANSSAFSAISVHIDTSGWSNNASVTFKLEARITGGSFRIGSNGVSVLAAKR